MKVGYFPGCALHSTAREYEQSLQSIAPSLGIQLEEVEDWACCGASSAHLTNNLLSMALPARTLMLAQRQNLETVFAPCATCFNRLATAQYAIRQSPELASQLQSLFGASFTEVRIRVLSMAHLLLEHVTEIGGAAAVQLAGVKIACYYGCLLVRPPEITRLDDPEAPTALEKIVSAAGAVPVRWDMATECCGGAFSQFRTTSAVRLSRAVIHSARAAGAHAIVVACPMCQSNLDYRQQAMSPRQEEPPLPILYLSQLVGLSMRIDPLSLGLGNHFVSTEPLIGRLGANRGQTR